MIQQPSLKAPATFEILWVHEIPNGSATRARILKQGRLVSL